MTVDVMTSEVHFEHPRKFTELSAIRKAAPQLCKSTISGSKRNSLRFYQDSNPNKKSKVISNENCNDLKNTDSTGSAVVEIKNQYQHGILETPTEVGIDAKVLCSREQTISIHETYQLAYLDSGCDENDSGSLYVFDFVDGLEVTYPVSISNSEPFTFDMPPLFVEPQYTDHLTALATEALNQLTQRINNWLSACQKADENLFIWRHLRTYKATVELRKVAFRLLSNIAPQMKRIAFDPHSPTVDKLFSKLNQSLQNKSPSKDSQKALNEEKSNQPVVSLCPDADHCLNNLRDQLMQLLKCLLPNLSLPSSFNPEIDLIPLIETICGCNANSS